MQIFDKQFMVILINICIYVFIGQGLILIKALKDQKDAEDESTHIAFGNLCSEVITLRNEALDKDKVLLSLVERLKSGEARLSSLSEADKKIKKFEKKQEIDAKRIADLEFCIVYLGGFAQI
jgi:hypothetical protein